MTWIITTRVCIHTSCEVSSFKIFFFSLSSFFFLDYLKNIIKVEQCFVFSIYVVRENKAMLEHGWKIIY